MGIMDLIKRDVAHITTTVEGFSVPITFINPDDGEEFELRGLHTRHSLSFNTDGMPINGVNAHVSVSESEFVRTDYNYKNEAGEISLKGHFVKATDSGGNERIYEVREWYPDDTISLIVCVLTDIEALPAFGIFDETFDFTFV